MTDATDAIVRQANRDEIEPGSEYTDPTIEEPRRSSYDTLQESGHADAIRRILRMLKSDGIVDEIKWDTYHGVLRVTLDDDYVDDEFGLPTEDSISSVLSEVLDMLADHGWFLNLENSFDGSIRWS